MRELTLIGYFPKKVVARPDWLKAEKVTAIRSVSNCNSDGPKDWIQNWTHNDNWVYSTIAAAVAVVPAGDRRKYEMHAYKMLPAKFDAGRESPMEISRRDVQLLPGDFERLGFDAVSRSVTPEFECSPLSCNSMAEQIVTNEHCLIDDFDAAVDVALRFSNENPEPGPYYLLEVYRWSGRGDISCCGTTK